MTRQAIDHGADWAGRPLVAVAGMGLVVPGGNGVTEWRRALSERRTCFLDVPADRWDRARYDGDAAPLCDRVSCHRGAFLRDPPFSAVEFGMTPSDGAQLHRMEKALLLAAREALADAAIGPEWCRHRRGAVIIGSMGYGTAGQRNIVFTSQLGAMLDALRSALASSALADAERADLLAQVEARYRTDANIGGAGEDRRVNVYSSVAAARIARLADIRGPHYVVDAACASSFAAISEAVLGLQDGRYDVVVTGGASPQITPMLLASLAPLGVLGERVTPFRRDGGGTLLGEGATIFVLRRLADVTRDGRRVRSVIRGIGMSANGPRQALFTSQADGQVAAIRQAYDRAGDSPACVQYVEAHANGVLEGDRVELAALNAAFGPAASSTTRIALGSVKDRIGYLLSGAGAAGLARTILAMEDGVVPVQAECAPPDDALPFADGPFHLSTEPRPWQSSHAGLPLRAGVSASGFGGSNFHIVLESFEPAYHAAPAATPSRRTLRDAPVAIIGMGTMLSEAGDPCTLWSNILVGREPSRSSAAESPRPSPADLRIPPRVMERIDPGHLWLLAAARQALRGVDLPPASSHRTGVFVAATPGARQTSKLELRVAYAEFHAALAGALADTPVDSAVAAIVARDAELHFKRALPVLDEDALLGILRAVAAGRVAQLSDATGTSFAVDAACASSFAALDIAVRRLVAGELDLAVVGGYWRGITPEYYIDAAAFDGTSRTGVSRPYDTHADGAVPAEGAAVVVLKRCADLAAADPSPLAIIRGLGASGNGASGSLFTPSVPGMQVAIREALSESEISAETVGLIEGHGSCTPFGDLAELMALGSVYGRSDRTTRDPALTCIKGSVGNLMSVSGLASTVAAVLALQHGVAPPVLHTRWDAATAPGDARRLKLSSSPRPWPATGAAPRRAAVSAYAMGGVNYHLVLEAPPEEPMSDFV